MRLQGFYSPQLQGIDKGSAVVIHGWEGSAESAYVLCMARHLFDHGLSVCRLNLRDHGDTYHLNQGLFYATRLAETHQAVKRIAVLANPGPLYILGFSMGGNFALRIGLVAASDPIPNLRHIAAVSPVLNPDKSTTAVDCYPLIRWYFMKKWKSSLQKKQLLFPKAYDFSAALSETTIRQMSILLVQKYSGYASLDDYFAAYTLTGAALGGLSVPTTIITARDDPIVPVEDFYELKLNDTSRLVIHRFGGHSGFVEDLTLAAWHERRLPNLMTGSDQKADAAR